MEENIKNRIRLLLKENNLSFNAISDTNAIQAKFSRAFGKGDNARLSFELIEIVLNKFPDISLEWLVYGDGEKYKPTKELPSVDVSSAESIDHSAEVARLVKEKNELVERCELLERMLEQERKDKERAIAQLDYASAILRERLSESSQKVG